MNRRSAATDILHPDHAEVLARFNARDALIALDYDGTLAPIVDDPSQARMRHETRQLLIQLASHRPTMVITGRKRQDVETFLDNVPVMDIVGNHGAESRADGAVAADVTVQVMAWNGELAWQLAGRPGIRIEDKGLSLSVHYRDAPDPSSALLLIDQAASGLAGARVVLGKAVVNVIPAALPNKGHALAATMKRMQCDCAVYVGDDDTDEDVFALGEPDRLLTVRVGTERSTAAQYSIESQLQIDELLRRLSVT